MNDGENRFSAPADFAEVEPNAGKTGADPADSARISPQPVETEPKEGKHERTGKVKKLEAQLAEQKASLHALQDRFLRLNAEFDNYRKRRERELSQLLQYEGEGLIRSVLPILDDLERMRQSLQTNGEGKLTSLADGMDMILGKFRALLKEVGVEPFVSAGQPFDPEVHDAILFQSEDDHGEKIVTVEVETGYRYKDRVIRHAKVIVGTKGQEPAKA